MAGGASTASVSLLDEAAAIGVRKGPLCEVARLGRIDPSLAAELAEAMASPLVTSTSIAAALKRRGVGISENTIQRHRRGACACRS